MALAETQGDSWSVPVFGAILMGAVTSRTGEEAEAADPKGKKKKKAAEGPSKEAKKAKK